MQTIKTTLPPVVVIASLVMVIASVALGTVSVVQGWFLLFVIVFFGINLVFWYVACLGIGIWYLAMPEESWNRQMHFHHDHEEGFWGPKKEAAYCLTGICRADGRQSAIR